jgi:S1-C subfamily serine protease
MKIMGTNLRVIGMTVVLVGAAVLVSAVPALRAQVRRDPMVDVRTMVSGGSEIGVRVRDVTSDDVTREKLPAATGAIVTEVQAGGPAATAGLAVGDVVLSFDGEKVRGSRHLARLIEETPEGREVPIELIRAGSTRTVRVQPRAAQSFGAFNNALERLHVRLPSERFQFHYEPYTYTFDTPFVYFNTGRHGAQVQDLTVQLGEYFGATEGALVTSVDDNSPAKTAGLKAGDVITAVNGQPIRSSADVQRRLRATEGKVSLTIVRDRKAMNLEMTISREAATGRRGTEK